MILYDESYNFLGMSEKTLNRLGYEDLDEFCTYHRDFADLFEKENGLIYNFENFSWIDFILYGGANKDEAIIKTKAGEKFSAKLKIDEIKIKDEILGISKLYSVKFIEKEIIESKSDSITDNKINLSSMLDESKDTENEDIVIKKDEPKDDKPNIENEISIIKKEDSSDDNLDINLSFIKSEDIKEDTKTTTPSFSLDFLKKDVVEEEPKEENVTQTQEKMLFTPQDDNKNEDNDEVVLNFFNSTIIQTQDDEELQTNETKQKDIPTTDSDIDNNITDATNINLSFLNKEENIKPISQHNDFKNEKVKKDMEEPTIELNFLKLDEKEEDTKQDIKEQKENKPEQKQPTPTINLNFLKTEDTQSNKKEDELKIDLTSHTDENNKDNELNFLKIDAENKKEETPNINLNFLKVEEEIKEPKEEKKSTDLKINLLDDIKMDEETHLSPEKKSKIIKQIKEDIDEIDQPQPQIQTENKNDQDDIVINDALKSVLNITPQKEQMPKKQEKPQIKIDLTQEKENILNSKKQESAKKVEFNFLPNINLSIEEKKGILKDFLDDAEYNLSLIKKYKDIGDTTSIKFLAVKIKSSAEILGLNSITNIVNKLIENDKFLNDFPIELNKQLENLKQYYKSE